MAERTVAQQLEAALLGRGYTYGGRIRSLSMANHFTFYDKAHDGAEAIELLMHTTYGPDNEEVGCEIYRRVSGASVASTIAAIP